MTVMTSGKVVFFANSMFINDLVVQTLNKLQLGDPQRILRVSLGDRSCLFMGQFG